MLFAEPMRLWLLLILPVVFGLMILSWRIYIQAIKSSWINNFFSQSRLPPIGHRFFGGMIFVITLALVVAGLARPYYLVPVTEKIYRNVRIIFCLDVSLSMSRAEDIKPNRLVAAKKEIREAINSLDGIYEIGLIPFAGDANTFYCPISFSRDSFLAMLEEVGEESVTVQGSDLVNVLAHGLVIIIDRMIAEKGENWQTGVNLIIVLSDGGKEENFSMDLAQLEKAVKDISKYFKIYAIGVGTPKPTPLVKRNWAGNFEGFMADPITKKIYYSELDESVLRKIGNWGGEKDNGYERFEKEGQLKNKIREIILKNRILRNEKITYEEKFIGQWFFAVAAVMIWIHAMMNRIIGR